MELEVVLFWRNSHAVTWGFTWVLPASLLKSVEDEG